jgi:glycosyltransferase involved in cell wall biosynthesis
MRRLDIGICAWKDVGKLARAVAAIRQHSVTDWRLLIVDNSPDDSPTRPLIAKFCAEDSRITARLMDDNVGYAGAVNAITEWSTTEYTAYLDHDAYVMTPGWDETLAGYLDRFHEIGMIFPGSGAYPIPRGVYTECMWTPGFCWMVSRLCWADMKADGRTANGEFFDTTLGHQEEADAALRVRLAGYKCAGAPEVRVMHDATATSNPANQERISRGVVNWVNKWCQYFGGKHLNYHSTNVIRWEDWNALYFEEFWKQNPALQGLNDNPEVVTLNGAEYDLIRVPRLKGFYRGRIV